MSLTILDVTPSEAHRKEILQQAENRRIANKVFRSAACERRPLSPLRQALGQRLVFWGQRLQDHSIDAAMLLE